MATKSNPKGPTYSITERGGRVYAATPFSRTFIAEAKRLTGARWHASDKEWSWPVYQREAVTALCVDMFGGSSNAPSVTSGSPFEAMFGCTLEALRAIFEGSTMARDIMVMGIMSDAQEAMMSGDIEGARRMINRAKWGLAEYLGVGAFTGKTPLAPTVRQSMRQSIAVVRDDELHPDHAHHAAEFNALADDEARGEMARGSEPEDFDPEMGF